MLATFRLNAASQWQSRSTLSVLKIAARKSPVVSVHNFTDPTKLMWYFECEGGDIDFYIRIHNREVYLVIFHLTLNHVTKFSVIHCVYQFARLSSGNSYASLNADEVEWHNNTL